MDAITKIVPNTIVRLYTTFSVPLRVLFIFEVFEYIPDSCCCIRTSPIIPMDVIICMAFSMNDICIFIILFYE